MKLLKVPAPALVLLLVACSSALDPARAPAGAPSVDGARMMRVAGALAHDSMQGRAIGSPGGAMARRLLVQELAGRSIEPLVTGYEQTFRFAGRGGDSITGTNLLGVIRGTRYPKRYIIVTAHYDHVGVRNGAVYNGADDNASGTVALLELASWFRQHPPEHSIVIALLDGEEGGLRGARAFLASPPVPIAAMALNVNLDMVGRNDRNELFAVGTRQHPRLRPFVEQTAAASAITLRTGHDGGTAGEDDWTSMSDQGAFHARGIPFLYFGVEDHEDYHKPTDDVERLQPAFFAAAAATIVDVVARIDRGLEAAK